MAFQFLDYVYADYAGYSYFVKVPVAHREVERKFVVGEDFVLPDINAVQSITSVTKHPAFSMEAIYFDTADLALFRWGITLRQRRGGEDAGWHLKLPVRSGQKDARDELHVSDQSEVPAAFVEIVAPLLMGRPLQPLVTLNTVRQPCDLISADTKIELVDDRVSIFESGRLITVFREVEIEVITGDQYADAVLDELSVVLVAAGAEQSSISKVARAFGKKTLQAPDVAQLPTPKATDLAADALRAIITTDVTRLLLADVDVRRDANDGVHQMRVAARRLRSALRTFSPLFDQTWADGLREDLAWIAGELGNVRDTEVLQRRLILHAETLPDSVRVDLVPFLVEFLDRRQDSARSSALAALRSDRHNHLIEDLVQATRYPQVTDEAFQPGSHVLIPPVKRSFRVLKRAMNRLDDNPATWHAARIKAKRTRYAVESLSPIFGKEYVRLGKLLSQLTEELGTHQDATVAQQQLADMADSASGNVAFGLGLLSAYELSVAMNDRESVSRLWPKVKRAARGAGL